MALTFPLKDTLAYPSGLSMMSFITLTPGDFAKQLCVDRTVDILATYFNKADAQSQYIDFCQKQKPTLSHDLCHNPWADSIKNSTKVQCSFGSSVTFYLLWLWFKVTPRSSGNGRKLYTIDLLIKKDHSNKEHKNFILLNAGYL